MHKKQIKTVKRHARIQDNCGVTNAIISYRKSGRWFNTPFASMSEAKSWLGTEIIKGDISDIGIFQRIE